MTKSREAAKPAVTRAPAKSREREVAEPTTQRVASVAFAAALAALGVWTLRMYLPALIWAAIFAIALWPLYRRARAEWQRDRHNVLTPALFTAGVALLFVMPIVLVAIQLGNEASGLLGWLDQVRQTGIPAPGWLAELPFAGPMAADWWQKNLADPHAAGDLIGRLDRGLLVAYSGHIGSAVLHRVVLFGFMLLTLFFIFRDAESLTRQMLAGSLRAFGPRGEAIGNQVITSVRGTVNGLVLVGLLEGILLGIAYVVAGVPHPVLLGSLTAIAATIPFGAALAFGVACLLLLAQGSTAAAIAVAAFGLIVVFVADHFIRPVLIGGATRLPFIWILLGILGGVETWGLLGLFLGPAIMAVLILLWREWTKSEELH